MVGISFVSAFVALSLYFAAGTSFAASESFPIPDEDWSYVNVRENAFMFWWLYGAQTTDPSQRLNKPLVMWLQGGPGGSSTGFGNFEELGPLTVDLKPRNTTWLRAANVLFVDNPVGTGYSYVTDVRAFTTNITGITDDLIVLFKAFLETYTVFQNIPFYIFCESYGGKYTSSFGVALFKAIQAGSIKCNFRGVALGDSWISPVDSVLSWGPYLYAFSQLDDKDLKQVNAAAQATADAVASGQYAKATQLWDETENVIEKTTDHVDIYNVLKHYSPPFPQLKSTGETTLDSLYARHVGRLYEDPLTALMNGPIRDKLGIIPCNVTWGGQSADVFKYQSEDFMKPVISDVSELLQYGMKVVIYQGQLDIICGTLGAEVWIAKLDWDGLADFLKTDRVPLYPPSGMKDRNTGAFYKAYKNLELYYIMKAGHMVPTDNGEMALEMVKRIID
ncbi:retinoid-inducible serine carboxypeptidase-like [Montipora capricornis]|uniref:retinoid-inducible serine carboxypeptidase-like n=1 Tax=Montipora foliosa TaxID=591990 RepID=UPI0035F16B4A